MLKCKFALNSIWQACTWQTAVGYPPIRHRTLQKTSTSNSDLRFSRKKNSREKRKSSAKSVQVSSPICYCYHLAVPHCCKQNYPPESLHCPFHVQSSPSRWRGCGLAGRQAKNGKFGAQTARHPARPAPKRNLRPPKIRFFSIPVSIDKQIHVHLPLVFWNKRLLHLSTHLLRLPMVLGETLSIQGNKNENRGNKFIWGIRVFYLYKIPKLVL